MKKPEDSMRVLKTATCKTLSGKSTLTYQIGCTPDSTVHLRISKNDGGGFFSQEWIPFEDIQRVLEKRPAGSPVLSHFITPLLKGKSVNTSAFLLAALSHLKLVRPLPKKKRQHELLDPKDFLDQVHRLTASEVKTGGTSGSTTGKTIRKTKVKKASTKKTGGNAAVKKRAMSRRKKATSGSESLSLSVSRH
jgi:hypothetical protein